MKPTKILANASKSGDLGTMRSMLLSDDNLATDWQPIMDACFMGQVDALKLLLEFGADPNIKSRNSHHYRPLHRTVEHKKTMPKHKGHYQVVDVLLAAGADPLLLGSPMLTSAITISAIGDSREFLPTLVAAAPNQHDIFHASLLGHTARVQELLEADPSLASARNDGDRGWTPMLHCVRSCVGRDDKHRAQDLAATAQCLLDFGADVTGCVDSAVFSGNVEVMEMLLLAGGSVADDDTINHAACDGKFATLEILLKHGTRLDGTRGTEHHGGYTPLGCAVSCRSLQGVHWFLEKGQDPNQIKSRDGENCLHVAVKFAASNKLLQLLLDHGTQINEKDNAGRTPLAAALEKNRSKAIGLLEAAGGRT